MNIIELLLYIFYGIIQGFFEVLPVSSSGLVSFFQSVTNDQFEYNNFFLVVVNIGSLSAIIIYMKKEIKRLLVESYDNLVKKEVDKKNKKSVEYLKSIVIAIIPIGVLGVIYTSLDINFGAYSLIVIGLGALITATVLFASRKRTDMFTNTKVTTKKAWYIGLVQLFSVIPGVSRLAITTAAGTQKELSYETSLTFSILMYIPISIGTILVSIVYGLIDIKALLDFDTSNLWMYFYYFIAMLVSFFGTLYALKVIFIFTRKGNFRMFYIYNLVFGFIALIIGLSQF